MFLFFFFFIIIIIVIIIIIFGTASSNYGPFAGTTRLLFFCLPACLACLPAFPAPFMSMLLTDVFLFFYIPFFLFAHPLDYD